MSFTKQTFALFINTLIQWFCPTTIRVSGEPEVASEMRLLDGGRLGTSFPARLIVMANHQVTDFLLECTLVICPLTYLRRMSHEAEHSNQDFVRYTPIGSTSGG